MISRVARTKEHWTETVPQRMKVTWLPLPTQVKNRLHATKPLPCFREGITACCLPSIEATIGNSRRKCLSLLRPSHILKTIANNIFSWSFT